jgi:cell division septum initiation protein DivIVA
MDILHLVDRLEALINESRRIPMTANRVVDEDRLLELIDQMRIAVPDEVKKAKRIQQEKDRIIAQAHEEAARILELAREEAMTLVQKDSVAQAAQARADAIIERAHREADQIKDDADEYIMNVLLELKDQLGRTTTTVQNGIDQLSQDRARFRAAHGGNSNEPPAPPPAREPREPERITYAAESRSSSSMSS